MVSSEPNLSRRARLMFCVEAIKLKALYLYPYKYRIIEGYFAFSLFSKDEDYRRYLSEK